MWLLRIWLLPIGLIAELLLLAITALVAVVSPVRAKAIVRWALKYIPDREWYLDV